MSQFLNLLKDRTKSSKVASETTLAHENMDKSNMDANGKLTESMAKATLSSSQATDTSYSSTSANVNSHNSSLSSSHLSTPIVRVPSGLPAPATPNTSTIAPTTTTPSPVASQKHKFGLDDFIILQTLGTGSFGRVHLVKLKSDGKFYAMKVLRKHEVVKLKQVEHTINEKNILEKLDFPFLVKMLGHFQDSANLYLILEYIQGGELFSFLRKSGVRMQI